MSVTFATCNITNAKSFLKQGVAGYHECEELDEVMKFVEADVIRIADPNFHAKGAVFAGNKYTPEQWALAVVALQKMSDVFDARAASPNREEA